jgi:hypothetical protein
MAMHECGMPTAGMSVLGKAVALTTQCIGTPGLSVTPVETGLQQCNPDPP